MGLDELSVAWISMATQKWAHLAVLVVAVSTIPMQGIASSTENQNCFWAQFDALALNDATPRLISGEFSQIISVESSLKVREAVDVCQSGQPTDDMPECGGQPFIADADWTGSTNVDYWPGIWDRPANFHVWLDSTPVIDHIYAISCWTAATLNFIGYVKKMAEDCAADFTVHLDPSAFVACIYLGIDNAPDPI